MPAEGSRVTLFKSTNTCLQLRIACLFACNCPSFTCFIENVGGEEMVRSVLTDSTGLLWPFIGPEKGI